MYNVASKEVMVVGSKNEKTSVRVAKIAGKLLSNPKTPAKVKSVAASVLTQRPDRKKK